MNKFIQFILFLGIIFSSCKKNQTGGKAIVSGVVAHHGTPIPKARVYIKFNTSEFPGDNYTNYDTYVDADEKGNYSISFYKGTYYLFAKGYDYTISAPYLVKGGLSVKVRQNEKIKTDIAVTED